ncbi:hypothetical protein NMY22_g9543 [Coprinellus aureogranulatus]|nr:hypothetical protein NMY22_g9543 [Coprinellus aureogranulatus]
MTARTKSANGKDKGKGREHHPEVNEFGGHAASKPYHPQHQDSIASTATTSSMDTATTSESSSTAWSSTSSSSIASNSSAATKMASSNSTPSTNLSRNFYSPYTSTNPSTVSPTSREAQYGPSQYLFANAAADGSSPSAASTPSDPSTSLLFSPNTQSFSSNAAHGPSGVLSPMSPGFNVVSPTGTVTQGRPVNGNAPTNGASQPTQIGHLSAARGMTRYLPLKDHSITFNFPLEAIVKMDVTRSAAPSAATSDPTLDGHGVDGASGALAAGELNPYDPHSHSSNSISSMMPQGALQSPKPNLQPSPLKLVVMQRVVPDDPSSVPQNPRLGAVFINLAEYVGKGKVERRFLLKESRVNATLKLSIEVNYLSGYQGYIAPPLPKAEILGGIEGFLKQHDNLLSKKKVKTMGASAVSRADSGATAMGKARSRGGVGGIGGMELGDFDVATAQQEDEVDLLRRSFLEKEKDRIGDLLVAHMKAGEGVAGANGHSGLGNGNAANGNLNPRSDSNPYELPSESESESEYGHAIRGEEGKDLVQLTAEALGRKQWKQQLKARKKEEVARKLTLNLSESEGDDSIFESADEGVEDEEGHVSPSSANGHAPPPLPYPERGTHIRVAAFDVQRLPLAYGPKTTESLIDALFNPGITTDRTDDDPFVMYVSPTELKRQDEWRREQEVRMQQYQEQISAAQQQNQRRQHHHTHDHWYRSKISRSATRDSGADSEGLMTKLKKGVKRAGTLDSTTSASTTSGSGSNESPDARLNSSMKSPGEDTIVGVRRSEDADWTPLGIAVDREATIGKSTGGGGGGGGWCNRGSGELPEQLLSYQEGAGEGEDGWGKSQPKTPDDANVLGGAFYDQEPQDMYGGSLGHHHPPGHTQTNGHQRTATAGTISSTASSSSLSSLGLSSQGHNHPVAGSPPQTSPVSAAGVRRSTSTRSSTSTGDSHHLLMSPRGKQTEFSAPPGRMDKTGMLKGTGPSPSLIGDPTVEDSASARSGGGLKGWWKGLQR